MPRKDVPYEEQNYDQKKNIFASIQQAFADLKYEKTGKHQWNRPVEQLEGCTLRMVGHNIALSLHRIETGTVETLIRDEGTGKKYLKEVEKELKKKFRQNTKKTLKLKKVKEDRGIEKYSRVQADTSWMLGSSFYGYGSRPVGRFVITDTVVYEFDTTLQDDTFSDE